MTTALEGCEGLASRPGRSSSSGKTRYTLYRRMGGSQGRCGQVRKISPTPGIDPRTVQPVASRYTDYATRLTKLYADTGTLTNVVCMRRLLPSRVNALRYPRLLGSRMHCKVLVSGNFIFYHQLQLLWPGLQGWWIKFKRADIYNNSCLLKTQNGYPFPAQKLDIKEY